MLELVCPRHPADQVGNNERVVGRVPEQRGRRLSERYQRAHLRSAGRGGVPLSVIGDEQDLEASFSAAVTGHPVRVDRRHSSGELTSSGHAGSSLSRPEFLLRRVGRRTPDSRTTATMPHPPLTAIAVAGPRTCAIAPARAKPAPCRAISPAVLTVMVRANSGSGAVSRIRASRPST